MAKPATITGDKALLKLLKKLPDKTARKVSRQAVNAGATPILKAARRLVSVDDGTLKKALDKKVKTYKKTKAVVAIIGPRSREAPHGSLLEFGSGPRIQTTTGREVGSMPAKPFLRPAAQQEGSNAFSKMRAKMGQGIEREAMKLKGKK